MVAIFLLISRLIIDSANILSEHLRFFLRGILILEAYLLTLIITKSSRNKFLSSRKYESQSTNFNDWTSILHNFDPKISFISNLSKLF